jgi:glycosyltransferase involved in cell wall biosynthesis
MERGNGTNAQDLLCLVSIVIPCYKGARYLGSAIESCQRQSYANVEIIVVDDGSPDNCAEIAERYRSEDKRVRVIRRACNGGISAALNTGYDAAGGEFFTRLAQDDIFREDAIALMKDRLTRSSAANVRVPERRGSCRDAVHAAPAALRFRKEPLVHAGPRSMDRVLGLVYCDVELIDEEGQSLGILPMEEPQEALATGNKVGVCVMWPRSVWETVGKFRSEYDTAEDYEYWLRVAKQFAIDKVPNEAPLYFRIHDEMGSKRFRVKQDLAMGFARARHCGSWWRACRFKSQALFEAGFSYREQGAFGPALRHILAAIGWWPLTLRNYRCLSGLAARALSPRINSGGSHEKANRYQDANRLGDGA